MRSTLIILYLLLFAGIVQSQRTVKIEPSDSEEQIINKAISLKPTAQQYAYKQLEYICFVHFGINTFTRMEWGNGMEDPKIFNLQHLDTDQWCQSAKDAGMKLIMFTVKHHDGFCLWNSRYTKHGVMSSPFAGGRGDVLAELSKSCKKYGLKLGVYLSPADLYQIENKEGLYGNLSKQTERVIPRPVEGRPFKNKTIFKFTVDDYNEYFLNQLFELLTEYGPIHEVWFDGAHPKRKGGQKYNYIAWKELIKELAPNAVIFGKEDIRWCGNESGATRESEWDVVTFQTDPHLMNSFADMHGDLGSREVLYKGKYLHYLPAETNTSIREGWFYRDDTKQKVRNADDVFDMYERSVGGNSTFMLNIPPNREGRFPDEDVAVLKEVGQRIKATYDTDLLNKAKGDKALLDDKDQTIAQGSEFVLSLKTPVAINRFVLQEPIHLKGQRIEKHALDVWVNNEWKEVAGATVIGYKRILRFPSVTTDRIRIRILEARGKPYLSKVSAHFYQSRPPQLLIARNQEGMLSIITKPDDFGWKRHGYDYRKSLMEGLEIRYTLDGSEPSRGSSLYTQPFLFNHGEVKAKAFTKEQEGSVAVGEFGILKQHWLAKGSQANDKHKAAFAIDANPATYWKSDAHSPSLTIEFEKTELLTGMIYTPSKHDKEGLIEKGRISISADGKHWKELLVYEQGNLINDPTPRTIYFEKAVDAKFIKLELIEGAGGSKVGAAAEIDFLK